MPSKPKMSWSGPPNRCWVKMYKGIRYKVLALDLGDGTKEGTMLKANEWWEKKFAEIQGSQAIDAERQIKLELADRVLAGEDDLVVKRELAYRVLGTDRANEIRAKAQARLARQLDRQSSVSLEQAAADFRKIMLGQVRPHTFREIDRYLGFLAKDWQGLEPEDINEQLVETTYGQIVSQQRAEHQKKKRWNFFKRFVDYLGERGIVQVPRNLHSRLLKIRVSPQAIETWPDELVRDTILNLKPRMRLFALLALNTGMTNIDLAELRHDQLHPSREQIARHGLPGDKPWMHPESKICFLVRKRVKTASHASVPVVSYVLWPQTLELLKKFVSTHPTLALTTRQGTPLASAKAGVNGKIKVRDTITLSWHKLHLPFPFRKLRSIAATALTDSPFAGSVGLFLGHSPTGIRDKHYAAPSQEQFNLAIAWLRDRFFGKVEEYMKT